MGNGFTFELESLIFLAAALVVCEQQGAPTADVAVFGDDIIIPGSCVTQYTAFCDFLGFTVNCRKSYSSSYFRESCGAYYFKGINVKPIFLKTKIFGALSLVDFHNKVKAATEQRGLPFRQLVRFLERLVPVGLRYYGPQHLGRAVLTCNFGDMPAEQLVRAKDGLEGFYISGFVPKPLTTMHDDHGRFIAGLDQVRSLTAELDVDKSPAFGNDLPLRMETRYVFKKRIYVPRQWCDLQLF
jgi:hypothetical protein